MPNAHVAPAAATMAAPPTGPRARATFTATESRLTARPRFRSLTIWGIIARKAGTANALVTPRRPAQAMTTGGGGQPGRRQQRQHAGDDAGGELGGDDQALAIEAVGGGAGPRDEHQQGGELGEVDHADEERRPGQVVDEQRLGDRLAERAQVRHDVADEVAAVRLLAQRIEGRGAGEPVRSARRDRGFAMRATAAESARSLQAPPMWMPDCGRAVRGRRPGRGRRGVAVGGAAPRPRTRRCGSSTAAGGSAANVAAFAAGAGRHGPVHRPGRRRRPRATPGRPSWRPPGSTPGCSGPAGRAPSSCWSTRGGERTMLPDRGAATELTTVPDGVAGRRRRCSTCRPTR